MELKKQKPWKQGIKIGNKNKDKGKKHIKWFRILFIRLNMKQREIALEILVKETTRNMKCL